MFHWSKLWVQKRLLQHIALIKNKPMRNNIRTSLRFRPWIHHYLPGLMNYQFFHRQAVQWLAIFIREKALKVKVRYFKCIQEMKWPICIIIELSLFTHRTFQNFPHALGQYTSGKYSHCEADYSITTVTQEKTIVFTSLKTVSTYLNRQRQGRIFFLVVFRRSCTRRDATQRILVTWTLLPIACGNDLPRVVKQCKTKQIQCQKLKPNISCSGYGPAGLKRAVGVLTRIEWCCCKHELNKRFTHATGAEKL